MPRGSKHLDERWQSPDRDLAQLNRELSNVLGVASIPFLVVDNDRRIRRVVPEAAELLGLSPEQLGQPVDQIKFEVVSSDLNELASQAIERAATLQREVRAQDGRWYAMRVGPFRTEEGKIAGALAAFVNIHEWKQSRDELRRETETVVVSLIETLAHAVLAVGSEGRIALVNAAAEAMFGTAAPSCLVSASRVWSRRGSGNGTHDITLLGSGNHKTGLWVLGAIWSHDARMAPSSL